ncbi:deoxyribonuclease-1-like [Bombina bombina]|uniref:deoxyribonuclease-1-like n=1 Tax=Bombina bombina TaxID=8345 RepID=UPI00235A5BA1|nr:deoxyribonuclease-1-like [Bombina bombina]
MMRLAIFVALALYVSHSSALNIGAFNIQAFGDTKINNAQVASVLMKILPRYDIVLIQEVRDADLSAVKILMNKLNCLGSGEVFSYVVSDQLGRDTYKERYLFVYRNDHVAVLDSYHYHDHNMYTQEDTFSREPFVVLVRSLNTDIPDFALVPLHSAPKDAVCEIDALYDVYEDVIQKFETNNIIFLGDFNADCSYVKSADWSKIRLRNDEQLSWLIPDSIDTTAGNTDCAYDRIVVSGEELQCTIKPNSAKVFNFQNEYGLTLEEALAVSDHYPVEVVLEDPVV